MTFAGCFLLVFAIAGCGAPTWPGFLLQGVVCHFFSFHSCAEHGGDWHFLSFCKHGGPASRNLPGRDLIFSCLLLEPTWGRFFFRCSSPGGAWRFSDSPFSPLAWRRFVSIRRRRRSTVPFALWRLSGLFFLLTVLASFRSRDNARMLCFRSARAFFFPTDPRLLRRHLFFFSCAGMFFFFFFSRRNGDPNPFGPRYQGGPGRYPKDSRPLGTFSFVLLSAQFVRLVGRPFSDELKGPLFGWAAVSFFGTPDAFPPSFPSVSSRYVRRLSFFLVSLLPLFSQIWAFFTPPLGCASCARRPSIQPRSGNCPTKGILPVFFSPPQPLIGARFRAAHCKRRPFSGRTFVRGGFFLTPFGSCSRPSGRTGLTPKGPSPGHVIEHRAFSPR